MLLFKYIGYPRYANVKPIMLEFTDNALLLLLPIVVNRPLKGPKLQKLLSTKVCAVELSLLDEESFLEQELIVKTISRERIMGICLK